MKIVPVWQRIIIVLSIVILLGLADWKTGYELNFFVFYFTPISLGAWWLGFGAAVSFSVLSAMVWFAAGTLAGLEYPSQFHAVWNTAVRLVSFLITGWTVSRLHTLLDSERKIANELRHAASEIKVLGTMLPICAACKKIRDENGAWQQMEAYISDRSHTRFSHSYCPDCYNKALKEAGLAGS